MKKLMILGGTRYIVPLIKKAHELDIEVITCDYYPENIAHKHSDDFVDLSVTDKDAIHRKAEQLKIDGIVSFACDPGVVTAAYVAEQMNLPFQCSYETAEILQNKGEFRKFLRENGFNSPRANSYRADELPGKELDNMEWPLIIKPTDSAGSKGVTKIDNKNQLEEAVRKALEHSIEGSYIVEEFLTFEGFHSSADLFTIDGKLVFTAYSDQLFDTGAKNPYVPSMIIWPSTMKKTNQDYLTGEIQRLMDLLKTKNGIYNIETCVATDGKPYIMEVSPRGGGCKIAEIQEMATGVKLIENEIRQAVGMPIEKSKAYEFDGIWCESVIHSLGDKTGTFDRLEIDPEIEKNYVKTIDMAVVKGDMIMPFTGANMTIGDMILKFDSREKLDEIMSHKEEWMNIRYM